MVAQSPRAGAHTASALGRALGRAFIPLAPGRPARRGGLMGEGQPDCSNDGSPRPEGWRASRDTRVEPRVHRCSGTQLCLSFVRLLSQSSRAGMTQRAIRSPSSLKRPSCLSMKPTVARRFSHWDNVPTLQGLHSQPSKPSPSPKCRLPRKLFVLPCAVARCAQPVTSSSRPCRSLTNRAAGGFLWTCAGQSPCANGPSGLRNRDILCLCARQTPVQVRPPYHIAHTILAELTRHVGLAHNRKVAMPSCYPAISHLASNAWCQRFQWGSTCMQ